MDDRDEVSPPPPLPKAQSGDTRVVAIGASAGGLEAIQTLLDALPADTGATFVIAQHLSGQFKSYMDEILAKHTNMKVQIVRETVEFQPNVVYLNAPQYYLRVQNGCLVPQAPQDNKTTHFPIDDLFSSLADEEGERAIAVILSGTGSDGTKGARVIHATGGVVIAQGPQDAKFDGMPNSAINAGVVDVVLDVRAIADKLGTLLNHPLMTNEASLKQQVVAQDDLIQRIFWLLKRRCDVDFSNYKMTTIARRLERRIALNNLNTLLEYFELLQSSAHEVEQLRSDLLIGATQFFRDLSSFNYLQHRVIPDIAVDKAPGEAIRIWSVGCSTGEEAYSLAMACIEALDALNDQRPVKVFATDIDPQAITRAGNAVYPKTIIDDVDPQRLDRFFYPINDEYAVSKDIRKDVVFSVHNLLIDPPFSNIDLCVCRNLLIYLSTPAQRRALSLLHFSLRERGYLFLGRSESLGDLGSFFSAENVSDKVFRKEGSLRIPIEMGQGRFNLNSTLSRSTTTPPKPRYFGTDNQVLGPILNHLAASYSPPTLAIDQRDQAFHNFGDTRPFTRRHGPGAINFHIENLLSDEVKLPVLNALATLGEDHQSRTIDGVPVTIDGEQVPVTIRIHTVEAPGNTGQSVRLISFIRSSDPSPSEPNRVSPYAYNADQAAMDRIHRLEEALRQSRDDLDNSTQDLESTNEELQSTNEELMTANEELQSTNEELQSVNEELYTINSEYQDKIQELIEAQNDIDKLLELNHHAVMFLTQDLKVRRFTSAVKSWINIIDQDLGRPISDFTHKFDQVDLNVMLREVLETGTPRLSKLLTSDGRQASVHIRPYVTLEGKSEGLIVSLIDESMENES